MDNTTKQQTQQARCTPVHLEHLAGLKGIVKAQIKSN